MINIYEPIFIICTGRSGSTLLRYILDTHEMIYAPQELHMGKMISEMRRITRLLLENEIQNEGELSEAITAKVGTTIDALIRSSTDKKIWCDKSITSVDYIEDIMLSFPRARYLFLYRDCMDFVHSALEVSRYGFEGFGFEEHILKSPKNLVEGLVDFWCLKTEKRLRIQENSNYTIHAVRYEDIINTTDQTVSSIFEFLNLKYDHEMLGRVFTNFRAGKGDLKIQSSSRIYKNTGKGRNVPLKQLSKASISRLNNLHRKLGYPLVDDHYNYKVPHIEQQNSEEELCRAKDYLVEKLNSKAMNGSLKELRLGLNIPGIITKPWIVNFSDKRIEESQVEDSMIDITLRLDTLLAMIDQKQNISMAYRDGLIVTNASYELINKIGKYLFS